MADAAAAVATNALPLRPFSEDEFVNLGLEMRGNATAKGWKNLKHSSQIDLFKSTYGPHPLAVSLIWMDLQRSPFQADRIDDSVEPKHLLVMYRWLKSYESEKELYSNFGFPVKNIRKWCDDLSKKVALLRKIKIDPNWEDDDGLVLAMDGIHYVIDEPRPFSKKYSSHKEGGNAGLVYEYCVYTHKDKVAWINGPFPAGTNDIAVLHMKLKAAIKKKQDDRNNTFRVIADDGYFALELLELLSYRNKFDPSEISWFKDRSLSRHEKFNGLTKAYACLTTKFRHDRGDNPDWKHPRHKACVEAICVTIQYEFDAGCKSLFDPYPT